MLWLIVYGSVREPGGGCESRVLTHLKLHALPAGPTVRRIGTAGRPSHRRRGLHRMRARLAHPWRGVWRLVGAKLHIGRATFAPPSVLTALHKLIVW